MLDVLTGFKVSVNYKLIHNLGVDSLGEVGSDRMFQLV